MVYNLKNSNTKPTNPNGSISFKDVLKGKNATPTEKLQNFPGPYIVKQTNKIPTMEIISQEVKYHFVDLQKKKLIFQFNGS